jgi:hypothetical protein
MRSAPAYHRGIEGTIHILDSIKNGPLVHRVVNTSSFADMLDL